MDENKERNGETPLEFAGTSAGHFGGDIFCRLWKAKVKTEHNIIEFYVVIYNFSFRNRKHVPCFYRVYIVTQVILAF